MHKIVKCECGNVLMQCRCPTADKPVEIRKPCQCSTTYIKGMKGNTPFAG